MTISSSTRRAGPYDCDGVDTTFNFSFKVFSAADVKVTLTNPAGVDTVISSYSVTLNPDQDATPGGFITTVATYGIGNRITITGAMPETQGTSIPNAGGFFPKVIEAALDKLTILVQQLRDESNRSFRAGVTSPGVVDVQPGVANSLIGWNATATGIENKALTTTALISGPSDADKTVQINGAGVPVLNAPAAARAALGATATGAALFTAADAAAGRAALSASQSFPQPAAVTTTSGNNRDLIGIPAGARRVVLMLSGVSTNGSNQPLIQLGTSGGIQATGYTTATTSITTAANVATAYTNGWQIFSAAAANAISGSITFTRLDPSANTWVATGIFSHTGPSIVMLSGAVTLSGALDRLRLTTVGGTDAFDAGSINLLID
jgi:hypothetical protein